MPSTPRTWRKFFAAGGYDAVEKLGKRAFAKKADMSRMQVDRLLKEPKRTSVKGTPQYVTDLESSKGWKDYERQFRGKLKGASAEEMWKTRKRYIEKAFLQLKKNPENWEKEDYDVIWKMFYNERLGGVPEQTASPFHNLMKATDKGNLLPLFAGVKHQKGKKKEFWLSDEEIRSMIQKHPEIDGKNDLLIMIPVGCCKGARISSLMLDTPNHYNWTEASSQDFEVKAAGHQKGGQVIRYLPPRVVQLVKRYVDDCKLGDLDRIFPDSYSSYQDRLQKLARAAKVQKYKREAGVDIPIEVGTHIFKHTFVTQASRHQVPAETIGEQTHTELRTLQAHYWATDPAKSQHFMQGKPIEKRETFVEWMNSFMDDCEKSYEKNCASDERCRRKAA